MDLSVGQAVLLFFTSALACAINAVAGGGSLLSFPMLTIGLGLPERLANATNSVGLWPGSLSGGLGFKNLLGGAKKHILWLLPYTMAGSVCGALLLLNTPDKLFRQAVPVLILFAALLLLLQPKVKAMVGHPHDMPRWVGPLLQFFVAVYGGYFGAGMGIMMLASFALTIEGNTHELNAIKNWLGVAINVSCSGLFLWQGLVVTQPALVFVCGAVVGGYLGARWSQRIDPNKLRTGIAISGLILALWFAYRAWF